MDVAKIREEIERLAEAAGTDDHQQIARWIAEVYGIADRPWDDSRHHQLVHLERQNDGLAKRVLDLERALGVVYALLRDPDRKVPGSHNTLHSDLARWFVRRELRRYSDGRG